LRPDTGNPLALSSFRTPVPLPTQDPDADPTVSITFACSWLPYIRGALMGLTMQYTWPQGDPDAVLLAQQRAMTLISMFTECDFAVPFSCTYEWTLGAPRPPWDFTDETPYVPPAVGVFTPGIGFQASTSTRTGPDKTLRGIFIEYNFAATTLTGGHIIFDYFQGDITPDYVSLDVVYYNGSTIVFEDEVLSSVGLPPHNSRDFDFIPATCDRIVVQIITDFNASGVATGDATIGYFQIRGEGVPLC